MRGFLRKRVTLAITLVLLVFVILLITVMLTGFITMAMLRAGLLGFNGLPESGKRGVPVFSIGTLLGLCVIIGTAITAFFSKYALNPVRRVIDATNRVAEGDYSVNVDLKGVAELKELGESFNKMTKALSSVETLRSDFISSFSHEFRTPIVSIMGFAKLLKSDSLTEAERLEYIDIIETESKRLVSLSEKIMNIIKFETLEIVSNRTVYHLDEQIRHAILILEPQWEAKDLHLELMLDDVIYEGDEDLTLQIWLNLIENAVKFSNPGDSICIGLKEEKDNIEFFVRDEGFGISEDAKRYIFDKFYQADEARSVSGNGLGLPLVKRIVKLCNGSITVDSEELKGTTMTVNLPKRI